jgi:hypothetical protein
VIEAVFEELSVKQRVFAEVEAVVRPDCVLATNTSSLPVTDMAAGLAYPARVVGFHFFNPVAMMPLVEVVRGTATDDASAATALAVGRALKKNCVLVKDAPAFVVNRLLTRFLGEIIGSVDEGTPFGVAEHAPDPLGLPMSPFFLLQLVGPAVALHVGETLAAAYPDRFRVSPKLRALVAAGKTAVYAPDFTVDESMAAILAGGDRPSTAEEVRARARGVGQRGPGDARRGRRGRAGGYRPMDDPGRRLALLPRRDHALPGPVGDRGEGDGRQVPALASGWPARLP